MVQNDVEEYIDALKNSDKFGPQVAAHKSFPSSKGQTGTITRPLAEGLTDILSTLRINSLYSHQATAIDSILKKKDVLVSTPTASGKSLIYNIPVFNALLDDEKNKALYLFPLKALAQDQLRVINAMADLLPSHFKNRNKTAAAIYDGDTTAYMRKKIRDWLPGIIITNPDMLHLSMLPYHDSWSGLFCNLTHIIIDEIHTYRGVFGSHTAMLIKRLSRMCSLYGSKPTFVLSSATIGNPEELGRNLIDREVQVVSKSGAPRAKRNIILLNPLDSAPYAATQLLEAALRRNLRTIVYTQSRKMTELITMWTEKRLGDLQNKITSYRAGFLPEDRRNIEKKLTDGSLLGVITTSALELGIDIGSLDICILVGYPGSIMSTLQRAGRVGRSMRKSLMVLVGHEDALDQHFMRNPEDFFQRDVEPIVLNPDNENIGAAHLVCAAAEAPLTLGEDILTPLSSQKLLQKLTMEGQLLQSADGMTWFSARKYPQRTISLRGSGKSFTIRKTGNREVIGEVDGHRVVKECHSGAIYLHMAKTWHVDHLDLDGHEVLAAPIKAHYFTRAVANKTTEILQTRNTQTVGSTVVHFGRLRVTEQVTGYRKYLVGSQKNIGYVPLQFPPQIFETEGLWLEIPEMVRRDAERNQLHFMGGIHAAEHAMIAMMPLLVLCDRNDIGGISHPWHDQLEGAAVFIYDGYSGGIGLTKKAFSNINELLTQTLETITACQCELGCPSCVHSPKCGSGNRPIDKVACIFVLQHLLSAAKDSKTKLPKNIFSSSTLSSQPLTQPENSSNKQYLFPERYGVFDVETKRSAKEVGGWHRAERMGVSVAVLYDSKNGFIHYRENEMEKLIATLFQMDLIIGFNNKRFDNKVLSAYTKRPLHALPTLDILEAIANQLGYRLSLDRLAEHTLGVKKSGSGLLALQWYKEGKFDLLSKYCQKDVDITHDLFLFGLKQHHLLFQNKAGKVVRLPVQFDRLVNEILTTGTSLSQGT